MKNLYTLIFCILLLFSCNNDQPQPTLPPPSPTEDSQAARISFSKLDPASTGLTFKNQVDEKIGRNATNYDYFYNGGGVALADFDNDGWTDIFLTGNDSPNAIYRNKGNLQFEDRSAVALPKDSKWTFGVTTVDINNDGYLDLYLSNSGPETDDPKLANQLLINNGDFTFTDQAKQYGLDIANYGVQADFFDFDNDGDLDAWLNSHGNHKVVEKRIRSEGLDKVKKGNVLYNLNKLQIPEIEKSKIRLLRNDGGRFVDVSTEAGVHTFAFGLGLSVADFNDDGFLDAYVANDYWTPDFYFINNGDGSFTNRTDWVSHISYFSMGSDAADYNNDGILDMMVVDMTPKDHYRNKTLMESMDVNRFYVFTEVYKFARQYMFNTFQVGVGKGRFSEIANALNISLTDWSWAPLLFDMNNDGYNDIYITNGFFRDTKNQDYRKRLEKLKSTPGYRLTPEVHFEELQKVSSNPVENVIYQNDTDFHFNDVTSGGSDLGPTFSNGVAYGDLDNDGDPDLVVNNLNSTASILKNNTDGNHFLKVRLTSTNEANIKNTRLTAYSPSGILRRDYTFTRGYLSCMQPLVFFGLGPSSKLDSLVLEWPNGSRTVLNDVDANQTLEIDYAAHTKNDAVPTPIATTFLDASNIFAKANLKHEESFFNDFKKEVLLPHKYSTLGPALASGDINNDGNDDFYLGGSKSYLGRLFVMGPTGFVEVSQNTFANDKNYEDIGAVFVDVNNDGLQDLYVSSGGGGEITDHQMLQDRVYINKGNNQFEKDPSALPRILSSTQTILPIDIDNDKDFDLFVGGRNQPGKYPDKASSYLLENEGGKFRNIIDDSFLKALPNMVTDATSADLNGDGFSDLVVCGEWSTPQVYLNTTRRQFKRRQHDELSHLSGWWYSIEKADFNNDGKTDFVLGNLGTNNKFHATFDHPLNVLFDDFDENGSQDIFLTKHYNGKVVPVRGKECSSEQMPVLNKKFQTYHDFASASIEEVLGRDKVRSCGSLTATYFKSVVLMNTGSSFEVKELPFAAQWAPILDSKILDVNADGIPDILVAGNMLNTEPETPSYDAGKGLLLYGRGDGSFDCIIDISRSGLNLKYNAKKIELLKRATGQYALLVANNNGVPQLYMKR